MMLTNDAKAFVVLSFFERLFVWAWFLINTFAVINGGNDGGAHEIYQWNEPVCWVSCLPSKHSIKYF